MKSHLELSNSTKNVEVEMATAKKLGSWLLSKLEHGELKSQKAFSRKAFFLEISLLSDAQMPKNVLSFEPNPLIPRPDLQLEALGEIHLNPHYISSREESFEHMLIHGFLHLLGYEHDRRDGRMVMEQLEEQLLKEFCRQP